MSQHYLPPRPPTAAAAADEGNEDDDEHEDGDSADSSAAWEDPNNYDRLLALGNHIGDVKTERWRLKSRRSSRVCHA